MHHCGAHGDHCRETPWSGRIGRLHQVRSALHEVLAISTIVWAHLSSIESVLELSQWKTAIQNIMLVIDRYVYLGLGNIAALDTTRMCFLRLNPPHWDRWVCANRFCRVLCPDGLQGACGVSAHSFLKLLAIGRSTIRSAVNSGGLPSPVRLDLSKTIFDSVSEAYHGLHLV